MSPATALAALGAGHTLWGLAAYGDQVPGIVRDLPFSMGDGVCEQEHSRDERAAAFWFLFAGPMLGVAAPLYRAAEEAGDRRAVALAGASVTAMCAFGMVAFRRSGFPAGLVTGLWMLARARRG